MRRLVLLALASAHLAACGGSTEDTPASSTPSLSPTSTTDGGPAWEPGPDSAPHSVGIGPIPLAPSEEKTVCVTLQLDNPDPVYVTRITGELADGSHHLILYKSAATQPDPTPKKCQPFSGILDGTVPLMIVERHDDQLVFPKGVGLKLGAKQMVRIEAHYINTGATPLEGKGTMTLDAEPVASASSDFMESDLSFWGDTHIKIPANGSYSTGQVFQSAIPGVHGFALTTHQHHLGTRMAIWYGDDNEPQGDPLADNSNWAEPPLYKLTPPIQFPDGSGLFYQCDWNNNTSSEVQFGESALEEMCFLWMYYYPSHGFDICFDGFCPTRQGVSPSSSSP